MKQCVYKANRPFVSRCHPVFLLLLNLCLHFTGPLFVDCCASIHVSFKVQGNAQLAL